jgi:hypothetical protein
MDNEANNHSFSGCFYIFAALRQFMGTAEGGERG